MSEETIEHYVTSRTITCEILKDRGTQVDEKGWEHHAYVVELVDSHGGAIEVPWRQGMGITTSPSDEPAAVLDALVSDAWGADQAFPDWATDYGYEMSDVHAAWETYQACTDIRERLIDFLGGKRELEYLACEVERL